jgi:hypothetical protein
MCARFSAQHLANTLWSLAVVQHEASPDALDSFAEAFLGRMAQATPQHFGNAAWAMAKLGHNPLQGRFLDALIKQVQFPRGTAMYVFCLRTIIKLLNAGLQSFLPA